METISTIAAVVLGTITSIAVVIAFYNARRSRDLRHLIRDDFAVSELRTGSRHQVVRGPSGRLLTIPDTDIRTTMPGETAHRIAQKKEALLHLRAKPYYYLDSDQVAEVYSQLFRELQPAEVETIQSQADEMGLRTNVPVVEARLGGSDAISVRKRYLEKESTPEVMCSQIVTALVEADEAALGLEDFFEDDPMVEEFTKLAKRLAAGGFVIPTNLQEEIVRKRKEEFAETKFTAFKAAERKFAIVQGDFNVTQRPDSPDVIVLNMTHPLNEALARDEQANKIRIVVICAKTSVKPRGATAFSASSSLPATVIGTVAKWDAEAEELLIVSPLAVH